MESPPLAKMERSIGTEPTGQFVELLGGAIVNPFSRESFSAGGRSPPWASISQGEFRFLMNTVSFDAECTGTFDIQPIQVLWWAILDSAFRL